MCGIEGSVRPLIHPSCRLVWLLLLQTLDGHSTEVDSVLFDVQEAVRLGGRELRAVVASLRHAVPKRAVAHAQCVCVCVCPRVQLVAAGSRGGSLKVWDLAAQKGERESSATHSPCTPSHSMRAPDTIIAWVSDEFLPACWSGLLVFSPSHHARSPQQRQVPGLPPLRRLLRKRIAGHKSQGECGARTSNCFEAGPVRARRATHSRLLLLQYPLTVVVCCRSDL